MPSIRTSAAVLIALLSLAGCAGPPGPPWTEAVSPSQITLRWYSDDLSEAAARQVADAHCGAIGSSAELAAAEQDGSVEIASYRCH
jgi:hypothetical protein